MHFYFTADLVYFSWLSDQFLGSYLCSPLTIFVKASTCPALVTQSPWMQKNLSDGTQKNLAKRSSLSPDGSTFAFHLTINNPPTHNPF